MVPGSSTFCISHIRFFKNKILTKLTFNASLNV
jgi:hypothetical protein